MAVVTISRQYGCGGPEIGRAVAEALGATYLDRDLLAAVSNRVGVPEDIVSERDERLHGVTERFLADIGRAFTGTRGPHGPAHRAPDALTDAQLLAVTRSVVKEVAAAGNAVIVGRGAQMILHHSKQALHVHVVAPLQFRIESVSAQRGVNAAEARRLIEQEDAHRASYLRTNYSADVQDPLLYHLVLNRGRLSQEECVQMIVFRASMMETPRPPQTADEVEAQRLLSSLQTVRDSIRSIVARYRPGP